MKRLPSRKNLLKGTLALVAVVLITIVILNRDQIDPELFRNPLRELGIWGILLFLVAFWFIQPLYVSVYVFIATATLTWEPITAFVLSYIGVLGCCITSFTFSRFIAQDWARARIPQSLMKYDEKLEQYGFKAVLLFRLVFYTIPAAQLFLGISRVRYSHFLGATVIGIIPMTAVSVFMGATIFELLGEWLGTVF